MTDHFPTFRSGRRWLRTDAFPTFRRFGRWWWRGTCRFLRRLPIILSVLLVVLGTPWTILNIKWGRELERELAALKAQGKPLTLVEATTRSVPESQNAAPIYQEVFGVHWPSEGGESNAPRGLVGLTTDQTNAIADALKQEEPLPRFRAAVLHGPPLEPVVEKLRQASERPHAVFPVNWEEGPGALFPHLAKFRHSARVVAFSAQIAAVEGRGDEALDTLGIAVRMAGHASEDPTLINQLVGYAMDAIVFSSAQHCLATAPASPEAMRRMYDTLRQREYVQDLVRALDGELAMNLDLSRMPLGDLRKILIVNAPDNPGSRLLAWGYCSWMAAPLRKLSVLNHVRYAAAINPRYQQPYREIAGLAEKPPGYVVRLLEISAPVFFRAAQKRDWAMAHNGLLQTALALHVYRQQHGRYPDTLAGLPWPVPEDPFSGKPFVYQRQGAGFRLYSFGPDLKDNRGTPIPKAGSVARTASATGWDGDIVWKSRR